MVYSNYSFVDDDDIETAKSQFSFNNFTICLLFVHFCCVAIFLFRPFSLFKGDGLPKFLGFFHVQDLLFKCLNETQT